MMVRARSYSSVFVGAWALGMTAAISVSGITASANAQEHSPADPPKEPTARERRSAAEAYDRGTAAYLAADYDDAATWFETAYRLAPSAAALVQAVRSHARAGAGVRAATLAVRLLALHPDDDTAQKVAAATLSGAKDKLVRVDVTCEGCGLAVDGTILDFPSFFLPPRESAEVVASFSTGDRRRVVTGEEGEVIEVSFEAPPRAQRQAPTTKGSQRDPSAPDEPPPPGTGAASSSTAPFSPAVVVAGAALTAALVGVTIWSGIDTLDGVDDYEAMPTRARLDEGRDKELRTNILIAATSVVGVVTAAIALLLTDWHDDSSRRDAERAGLRTSISPTIDAMGVRASVRGRF